MYFYGFTVWDLVLILPALLFAMYAQMKVKSTYGRFSQMHSARGLTGAQVARQILDDNGLYDVPGRATDGTAMEDASDTVYEFVLGCICPVALSKPGLCYNEENNHIEDRSRDWLVGDPMTGFLFPAFNDRQSDIHSLLYYSKKAADLQPEFVETMFGCTAPVDAGTQKEMFNTIISDTLGADCSYEAVREIHDNLQEMIAAHEDDPEPLELSGRDVKRLLEMSGVPEEKMENFDRE